MGKHIKKMVQAAVMAALTAAGAFVSFPLGLTSFSLQVVFTALAGILLGRRWGAASQGVYVALGLLGLPIFTQGGGLGYVLQPTFGFLLGLAPMAWVVGALAGEEGKPSRVIPACLAGTAVLYLVGVPYMGMILNLYMGKGLSVWTLVRTGMLIYLPGDAVKIAVVALVSPALCRAMRWV